jgi:chitin disaccharide deacetylase
MCEEVNSAIIAGLRDGIITSASAMVPCPAFAGVVNFAKSNPGADIGIHLTLTSEWLACRWRPVLGAERVPSLVDSDGCFWSTAAEVFAHGRLEEAEAELRAQIETALSAGIDVTHLDSHMFVLLSNRSDYYRVYLKLAREYRLAFHSIRRTIFHWCTRLDPGASRVSRLGLASPDHLVFAGWYEPGTALDYWSSALSRLPSGLTEIYCHPGFARAQLRRLAADADQRQADFEFFTSEAAKRLLREGNVHLITHRQLREQIRSITPSAAGWS